MKWLALTCVLAAFAACSAPEERRVADVPFAKLSEDAPASGEDRSFSYLKDELADHLDDCVRGWSHVYSAFSRGVDRDWARIETTLR